MLTIKIIFWILIFIVFYAYLGYGIVLYFLIRVKRFFKKSTDVPDFNTELPEVTLFITAYNEKDFIFSKQKNNYSLDYPVEKLKIIWVTDGSDDGSEKILKQYKDVVVLHEDERKGKINAMNRGIQYVNSPFVVFSDANTLLGKNSILEIVRLFSNPKVGCVSGEKRIFKKENDAAVGAGEGIYWRYESKLKQWDAELYSVVGAAGELFAVRTELYQPVEPDTLLDDFIISLQIAMQGYTIQYSPEAYAMEMSSANVREEMKRKIRIAAGGMQSVIRLYPLLNVFRYGVLSFQYISHRVLRWTLAPLSLPFIFIMNLLLANNTGIFAFTFYSVIFWTQILFYASALIGWYLENKQLRVKALFIPYYFCIMNLSIYLGVKRYFSRQQSVNWVRAMRGV
jgi:cellulose synthase/poly-beta-1,6-N-acetylglucosamine synthase-like glycosyltransferase